MGVKIADKLEQFNNGTYYLVDSSAVEYIDKNGNSQSVKDVLDNGIGEGNTTDLTDIENRITTNETNITGLQEQIDNLDIPENVDLTDINDKITQLENNQIKNSNIFNNTADICYAKITPGIVNNHSKILITDMHGGCLLITGALLTDYPSFKVVRLSNGSWNNQSPSDNTVNKIMNVYSDSSFIYVQSSGHNSMNVEGGLNVEKIETLPTEATELPILDLTQAASKRVYNSLDELNTAKGLSISLTNGEDNTMKIVDALSPIETFADYFDNTTNNNRFGIDTNTYGTDISLLAITKFNDNVAIIRAYMSNGKLLVRRYQNGVLQDWQYDKTDLTDINNRLTQLENTTSGGNTNNNIYTTEEQAVGTWINGKTLYRRTIEDNTLRETGTDMIKLFAYNTNMKIVKYEGVVTLANNNGQTVIRSLPYSKDGEEVYITKTTLDTLRLDSYLKNFKLGGYIVSVYYYKV